MNAQHRIDKTNPIRWGIIGCGDVTEIKSGPAYQQAEGFELAAVMRRDEKKAKDYAHRHGVPAFYCRADALIANVDAVYIATPPDSHRHYALQVAAAGKPCCIEKPMAPTYEECTEICAAFDAQDIPLFSAYYRRTLPRFTQIKIWIENRMIGDVRHVNWNLSQPPTAQDLSKQPNWRTDKTIAAGGYFDDLASHGLDLITYYLGNIQNAAGFGTNQQSLYSAQDALTACWIHESGVTGSGSWNFGCSTQQDRLEILGSTGKIECSIFAEAPIRLTTEKEQIEKRIDHPTHVHKYHVLAIRDALLHGVPHPSTGTSATHTAWVMDKILKRM